MGPCSPLGLPGLRTVSYASWGPTPPTVNLKGTHIPYSCLGVGLIISEGKNSPAGDK